MKQIIQDLNKGHTILEEVPVPLVKPVNILIKTKKSLVSLGTEKMLVKFGKSNYIQKARQQPDKVKMVLDKIKTDGLKPTLNSVFNKLSQPLTLGYCNVGEVVEVGEGVSEFKVGDRVASNGNHAEYVLVPKNLAVRIPDDVSDEQACFTVIGSIGLQGIRLLNPTFGETVVVIGLGLIGLVTAELLLSNGCNVIGFEFDSKKIEIAKQKGITVINPDQEKDPIKIIESHTEGIGADGVLITASNRSNKIISQAAKMCRKKGRVVLVGVVGLDIDRSDFYQKEISFQVSCSYGPGRYDPIYEEKGNDYPVGYVRWTENRNFKAVLNAISKGNLDIKPLITEIIPLEEYKKIYDNIEDSKAIASILEYDQNREIQKTIVVCDKSFTGNKGVIGIIGSGNYTSAMVLPNLKKLKADIKYISSSKGLSSTIMAKKYKIANSTTDYREILNDDQVDLVFITTKHNMHAPMVLDSVKAKKNVFVEKPLAISKLELEQIIEQYDRHNVNISVGFNRRFAPLARKMKSLLGDQNIPINIIATMNAGFIPSESWVHDTEVGGGRIIGEACHYVDLCSYLSGSSVVAVCMNSLGVNPQENTDNATILLKYKNGSNAVINYFSNGSKSYSKERIEVFSQERTLIMDNWRKLKTFGFKGSVSNTSSKQDKGQYNQFDELIKQHKKGGKPIIPFQEIVNTTKACIASIESLKQGKWIEVD